MIGSFPILSVIGFIVMFGGVVFAITGPRVAGGRERRAPGPSQARRGRSVPRVPAARSPAAWRTASAALRRVGPAPNRGVARYGAAPFFVRDDALAPLAPHIAPPDLGNAHLAAALPGSSQLDRAGTVNQETPSYGGRGGDVRVNFCYQMEQSGGLWGKVADNGATGAPEWQGGGGMFLGTYTPKLDDKGRLTLPAKFRDALAGGLMVTKSQDHSLAVYPRPSSRSWLDGRRRRRGAIRKPARSCETWPPPPTNSIPTHKAESRFGRPPPLRQPVQGVRGDRIG